MTTSHKVRYLQKTDFEACWNIFYKVFERHEDEPFLNAWISYNPALSYVIETDGFIEGFLLTRGTHIEFIGIHPFSQGKGLGTILLHNLLEAWRKISPCHHVFSSSDSSDEEKIDRCKRESISLSLVPSNSNPKLIRWYESNGFRKSGFFSEKNEPILIL